MTISPIPEILADIKAGKMVIITDAEDRENEGDLVMAAQFITPQAINFMIKHARGLVCLPMNDELVDRLHLHLHWQLLYDRPPLSYRTLPNLTNRWQ